MGSIGKEVFIRKLREEDADQIGEIYSLITKKPVSDDFISQIRMHAGRKGHEAPFVAELDGKVVGFMISYIVTLGFGAERSAYIATLGVHPRFMGHGIGMGMTEEVFKFYRSQGITRVYTSVRWDSTDLLSFCKTMGFERSDFINLMIDLDQ
jgi:ribosomal protein S18 acetylase RimI-like enzyme